jgi:hypothetical protein
MENDDIGHKLPVRAMLPESQHYEKRHPSLSEDIENALKTWPSVTTLHNTWKIIGVIILKLRKRAHFRII